MRKKRNCVMVVRMTAEDYAKIRDAAAREDRSISSWTRIVLLKAMLHRELRARRRKS